VHHETLRCAICLEPGASLAKTAAGERLLCDDCRRRNEPSRPVTRRMAEAERAERDRFAGGLS